MGKSKYPVSNKEEAFWACGEGGREKIKPCGSKLFYDPCPGCV